MTTDEIPQLRPERLVAPMAGEVIDLADVPDPAFASKKMGDGFAVRPTSNEVVAPADGTVFMSAKTGHALGFRTPEGLELLLHLGIDTVELEGKPFALTATKGQEVKAGDSLGTMDLDAVVAAGKDTSAIFIITNTKKRLYSLEVDFGPAELGAPVATAQVKPAPAKKAAGSAAGAAAAGAATGSATVDGGSATADGKLPEPVNTPSVPESVEGSGHAALDRESLDGYDLLAYDIIDNVGGADNIRSVIHCITRVRFYLKDEKLANDEVVANLDGVIDVAKAGGQYQVVIGPAVEEVFDAVVKQLPQVDSVSADVVEKEKPTTAVGWLKYGFSELIGVITGSMIPIIGLLAASGILKGILALLMNFEVITGESSTYMAINAMSDSVFFFLPIFVGFTAAKRLGSDPIVVAIIGGVLTYPTIVEAAGKEGSTSLLGMSMNADFFGIPYPLASYSYSIFPIIVAAWLASKVEPFLKKIIPMTLRMIFVPFFEVFIVSAAILLILGPIVMLISGGIAAAIQGVYDLNPTIAGTLIGGLYQSLVIFGLHWAVIPLVASDIASSGHSYLNALISATMVAQGGAVLAIFAKTKVAKIKQLAGSATLAAFSGITEPAMYGLNLKYGRAFITASIGGAVGGLLTGLFNVNMWGFTGSLIGFTSFINPKDGIDSSFWGYLIASAAALVVSFVLTYMFGFSDADLDGEKEVKKVRLGSREPKGT
ncbi:glucose PTS transporter subunit IIA [Luteococcus sp. OSA5]|uniref:glucose PTS transporter subunit IIA n=1 Tax=Luteococcus sp. OSA5 TaxID=3401630 RepID=UPI003B431F73